MEDPSVKRFVRVLRQSKPTETTTEQQLERIKQYYAVKWHQKTVLGYAAFLFISLLLLIVVFYFKLWYPNTAFVVFIPARVIVMYFDEVDKTRASLGDQRSFDPFVAFRSPLITALSVLSLVEFVLVLLCFNRFTSL